MKVTIIGSLSRKDEMERIRDYLEGLDVIVYCPSNEGIQEMPLIDIQRTWISNISSSDLVIAVPKRVELEKNGSTKYTLEFGESTSYEMAIARWFKKPVMFA